MNNVQMLARTLNISDPNDFESMMTQIEILLENQSELSKYEVRNPTEEELILFLKLDDTSETYANEYDIYTGKSDDFVCLEYATKLYYRARMKRINMSFIACNFDSDYRDAAHAFNGVTLANSTKWFVEPQNDRYFRSPEHILMKMLRTSNVKIINYGEIYGSYSVMSVNPDLMLEFEEDIPR